MSGVNKVLLIGNLGKDPEIRNTPGGTAVANFSIATSEKFKDKNGERQERTEWVRCTVWGKQAESAAKYLEKGRQVYVEGSLRTESWDDKETGQKRYATKVQVQKVVFLGGGKGGGEGGERDLERLRTGSGGHQAPPDAGPSSDDDIPF